MGTGMPAPLGGRLRGMVGWLLCFVLLTATSAARAEIRGPASVPTRTAPVGTLALGTPASDPYMPDADFYLKYCAPLDHQIQLAYLDQWHYQESQQPYLATSWNHQHLAIGATNDMDDGVVRNQFAQQVLRMRMDAALRTYFADSNHAPGLRHAEQRLNQMKNYEIPISNGEEHARFQIGYDVFSDGFKLEYGRRGLNVGLYEPHLLGNIGNPEGLFDGISLRVSTDLGLGLPSAYARCPLNIGMIEMGISQAITSSISTWLSTYQPLRGGLINLPQGASYGVYLSYQF